MFSTNGVVSAGIVGWATEQFNAIQALLDIGIPVLIGGVGVWLWWRAKWTFGGLVRSVIVCGIALWALAGTGLIWARDTVGETVDSAALSDLAYFAVALMPLRLRPRSAADLSVDEDLGRANLALRVPRWQLSPEAVRLMWSGPSVTRKTSRRQQG